MLEQGAHHVLDHTAAGDLGIVAVRGRIRRPAPGEAEAEEDGSLRLSD